MQRTPKNDRNQISDLLFMIIGCITGIMGTIWVTTGHEEWSILVLGLVIFGAAMSKTLEP